MVQSSASSTEARSPILKRARSASAGVTETLVSSQKSLQSPRSTRSAPAGLGPSQSESKPISRSLRRATTLMFTPPKPVANPPPLLRSIKYILTQSWFNVLLVCIPIAWALHFTLEKQPTLIFIFSFLSILPLAKLLAFATDELSMRVGQTLAGLLNATLGNAVELIVGIIALVKCQLHIVQSSLVGSVLSNLLLVLGMCFFAGGMRFSEQGFGISATQLNSSLLTISVIAVLLPGAFHLSLGTTISNSTEGSDILKVSHGVAIILLFIYASYLVFQLFSHKALYEDSDDNADRVKSVRYAPRKQKKRQPIEPEAPMTTEPEPQQERQETHQETYDGHDIESTAGTEKTVEEHEQPQLSVPVTFGLLIIVTVLVAVTAEFLVDSIDGLTSSGKISKEFVGIILLPIVGNAAEHVTAVTVSVKDKLTLSLGVAVGSSIQIALFVIPFMVILGWILGKPLTLLFDPLESIVMFLSVLTVNYCVQDGKSNWLEGMILMCLYLILGVTFWFYPGSDPSGVLESCY